MMRVRCRNDGLIWLFLYLLDEGDERYVKEVVIMVFRGGMGAVVVMCIGFVDGAEREEKEDMGGKQQDVEPWTWGG